MNYEKFKTFTDDYSKWNPITDRETWLVMPMLYDIAQYVIGASKGLPIPKVNAIYHVIQQFVQHEQTLYKDLIKTSATKRTGKENETLEFPFDFRGKFIKLCEETNLKKYALIKAMKRAKPMSVEEFKEAIHREVNADRKRTLFHKTIWMKYFEHQIEMIIANPQENLVDKFKKEWEIINQAENKLAELDFNVKASSLHMLTEIDV